MDHTHTNFQPELVRQSCTFVFRHRNTRQIRGLSRGESHLKLDIRLETWLDSTLMSPRQFCLEVSIHNPQL
jgi:hypothetical protein